MENDCVVFGCRNSTTSLQLQTKKNDCNFFHFPLNQQELTDKWLKKLCLEGWFPGPENVVCEEHFSLDSFVIFDDKRVLKQNAVPNLVDELDQVIINSRNAFYDESVEQQEENSDENEDLRCRICAKYLTQRNAIPIYSEDENVLEKMMACIPILVKTDDILPKQICRVCLADLNISYRMLVRAIESEKLFNSLLHKLQDKSDSEEVLIREEKQINNNSNQRTMCAICNLYFEDINGLSEHFQRKHVDDSDFNDQADVMNVKKVQTSANESDLDHYCKPKVDKKLEKSSADDKYDGNESRWICKTCDMALFSKEILASHIKNSHKLRVLKPKENGDIPNINETTISELVACQLCDLPFDGANALNEHIDTHIETMMCDICGFMCEDYQKMLNHREVHTKKEGCKNNTCDVCFTAFPSRIEMMQHKKKMHRAKCDAIPQKWICKYCGKETSKKLSLTIHERVHTGARPFVCELCGMCFKSKANLIQHQTIHTGVKRYKCSVCDKAFARKSFVHTHMRVHTGERPFRCDICGKCYTQIGDMRRHKKCHIRKEVEKFDGGDTVTEYDKNGEKNISIFESRNSAAQSDDDDGKSVSYIAYSKQLNGNRLTSLVKLIDESKLLPIMPSVDDDKSMCEEDISGEKIISLDQYDIFQNNSLIKLHFARDVTDFRRILVELQQ